MNGLNVPLTYVIGGGAPNPGPDFTAVATSVDNTAYMVFLELAP